MIADISQLTQPQPGRKVKRPSSRKLARVYPNKRPTGYRRKYGWYVVVGFYKSARVHYFVTEDEAREFAAKHNTPERLMAAFRPFFDTDGEVRAYCGIKKPKPEAPAPAPNEEQLTPQQVDKRTRYMIQQQFRVKPYRSKAKPHLKAVVRFREGGKYAKRYFTSEREAKAFANARNAEVASQGLESLDMPGWLRCMALRCNNQLAEVGKTLDDATTHYLDYIKKATASCTMETMRDEFVARQLSRGYGKYYCAHLKRLVGDMMVSIGAQTLVCNITPKQVSDHVTSMSVGYMPKTVNGYIRAIKTYFNFGVREGYLDKSPAINIADLPLYDTPPGVLTPSELERLLHAAEETVLYQNTRGGDMRTDKPWSLLPFYAIGAFAGIRVAEIQRLDWSEIDLEGGYIEVTALKSKTASRRLVRMHPVLVEWLTPYARKAGPVIPLMPSATFAHARCNILAAADALVPDTERGEQFRSLASDWPHNALRHSFASYHIAKVPATDEERAFGFSDAAKLALEMGHSTTAMIFKHYRRVVRPAQAELYWKVRRAAGPANVIAMPASPNVAKSSETAIPRLGNSADTHAVESLVAR